VIRRRWLSKHNYADLVAFGQFLPGKNNVTDTTPHFYPHNG